MSSVVGLNPPRSFTGFGSFGRGDFDAPIPLRISSAMGVVEFFVLVHGANLNRAHQIIGKIERCFHSRSRFPESWFCVNASVRNVAPLQLGQEIA